MDIKNIKIEEITDNELKTVIESVNNRQLAQIGYLSLYYSIYDSELLIKNKDEKVFIKLIKSRKDRDLIEKYYNILLSTIKDIDRLIKEEEYSEEIIKEIFIIRNELYDYFTLLKSYFRELKFVDELLNYVLVQKLAKEKYKDFYLSDLDLNRFFNDTMNFLVENVGNFDEFNYILGTVIRLAPFRMAKEKFIKIIDDNLRINFKDRPKSVIDQEIETIKYEFDGSFAKGYGIKFDYIFREVESAKKLKISKMTTAELENEIHKVREIITEVEIAIDSIKSLGLLTNKIYALYMSKDIISYEEIDKSILDPERENLLEELQEKINFYEESLFETINFFQEINEEAFSRGIPIDEEFNKQLEKTRKILAYYNDIFFMKENVLYPDLEDKYEENYIEQAINNLLQYLDRNIKSMGNLERKIRMRSLLSKLIIPFKSPDEFINYLKGALDIRVTSKEEIFSSVDDIYYFMNTFKKYKVKKDS